MGLRDRWRHLRLTDIRPVSDPFANEDAGINVDAPDRGEWEWPEHGGPFPRLPEKPVR